MRINEGNIRQYLDKFFEGETTRAEEMELSRYFTTASSLPDDIAPYKAMFAWIDEGMPESEVEISNKKRERLPRAVIWSFSVAAAAVIAILCFTFLNQNLSHDPNLIYMGSYVYYDHVKNDNISAILPEIQATLQQGKELQEEFDNMKFEI